jgi:hypothetical protein
MAEPKPTRKLTIVDLAIVIVIGAAAWWMMGYAAVPLSPVERGLAIPVCLTLSLAGVALHSVAIGRRVALQPISKIAYIMAWTASLGRYLVMTAGFGTLPPESIPLTAIAGSGMILSVASVIAAIVAAQQSFRVQRPAAATTVLFFGLYPAAMLLFDALRLTFGNS